MTTSAWRGWEDAVLVVLILRCSKDPAEAGSGQVHPGQAGGEAQGNVEDQR